MPILQELPLGHFLGRDGKSTSYAAAMELFIQVAGAENLIDQSAKAYRSRGLAFMDFDPVAELTENPALLRTPIVRSGRLIVVGENQTEWGTLAKNV